MTVIFSDNFETGDFSKWTSNDGFLIGVTDKGFSAHGTPAYVSYMECIGLAIPSNFEWNFDFKPTASNEPDIGIYNSGVNLATYELDVYNDEAYFYWRDASLVIHTQIFPLDVSGSVDVNGWVNIGVQKKDNTIFIKLNGITANQFELTDPYNAGLNAIFAYSWGTYASNDYYDNIILVDEAAATANILGRSTFRRTGASVSGGIECGKGKRRR